LLTVLRYVERNPLRATLCERAEDWKFGSLRRRVHGGSDSLRILSNRPIPRPRQWTALVNRPQTDSTVTAIRRCVRKGTPYGNDAFVGQSVIPLQLKHTLRPRGRPRKEQQ